MAQYTVLITGASRGIGASLAAKYLHRPSTTVIATVRNLTAEHEQRLLALPRGQGSELILLALDMKKASNATDSVARLKAEHGVYSLDLVIANAGICDSWGPVADMSEVELLSHIEVNTLGFLRLYKAVVSLLDAADEPKLVYMSTDVASISQLSSESITTEYGISKIAGNFLMRMISIEHSNWTVFSISPGFVQTDMGNRGAKAHGLEKAPVTVEECSNRLIKIIDSASKEVTGRFLSAEGGEIS
ncbi:hypothetical protein MKX07_007922 [Trichoderma sp. CBMAI-0711]|nr:hypothetical protein MKX07_007922 [Trichoderma sp. CBMAI-0711]